MDGKSARPMKTSFAPFSRESTSNQKTAETQVSNSESELERKTAADVVPYDLNLAAFFETICRSFLARNMWTAHEIGQLNFLECTRSSKLHQSSADALAYMYFGLYHHHSRIRVCAIKPYVSALEQLSKSLEEDSLIDSINGVLSIMLLLHYEVCHTTHIKSFLLYLASHTSLDHVGH